jgi:hypothetical protein
VRSGGSGLALLARGELSEVAVIISLPAAYIVSIVILVVQVHVAMRKVKERYGNIHLVVEHLALARLGLGDEALVEDIEDILADILELRLDLLAVLADDADVLLRALGLLFLLDAGDDAPRSTTSADHVLVGHGEQVTLVNRKFAADLVCLR